MPSYKINGGHQLSGIVSVSGSVNATLPVLCATLLTDRQCILKNVPDITDVKNLIAILDDLGSKISYDPEQRILAIDNSGVNSFAPKPELVKKLRGSILLLGPLLARFGSVVMPFPGGDLIGKRPIDSHLFALQALGVEFQESEYITGKVQKLSGAEIILNELSVTATENAIMAAVRAEGFSQIHLAATEPHVQDLCRFLCAMGAKISGIGTHDLVIEGVKELGPAEHTIIFDNEVAVSFMNMAAATKSALVIQNIQPKYLYSAINQFRQMRVDFEVLENSVKIHKPGHAYKSAKISSNIYPGLLTDYVPPFAALATQAEGVSMIHEWMYDGRLAYIHELSKMGANTRLLDQHRAEIEGPTKLYGSYISSLDVRSGMVLIIAALIAEGVSTLHNVEHVERKYEHILKILQVLGADIQRTEE